MQGITKPVALHRLEGTYDERRHAGLVELPDGVPTAPEWLSATARGVWNETVAMLSQVPGLLAYIDGPLLATYCECWETYLAAQEIVAREGLIVTAISKAKYPHPAVGIRNKARGEILRIGARFGMSPSDRSRLRISIDTEDDLAARYLT